LVCINVEAREEEFLLLRTLSLGLNPNKSDSENLREFELKLAKVSLLQFKSGITIGR